jgi:hypothetical protein
MPSVIKSVSFDAADALRLAQFWAAVPDLAHDHGFSAAVTG